MLYPCLLQHHRGAILIIPQVISWIAVPLAVYAAAYEFRQKDFRVMILDDTELSDTILHEVEAPSLFVDLSTFRRKPVQMLRLPPFH